MDADDDLEPEDDFPPEIDISELEGFKDEFWNLGQVVAWVNTRSPYVIDAYSDSTPTLAQRNNSIHPGFPEFAKEFDARCAERFGYVQFASPFANDELLYLSILRAFQTGQLEASGQRNDGSRERISEIEWADLVIGRALTGEIAVKQFNRSTAAWHDVRVRRSSILCAYEGVVSERAPHDCGSQFVKTPNAKGQGGRPPEYDWDEIKKFAKSQVDKHGKPGRRNRKLPRQEDLVNLILKEWAARDLHPSASNVRKYLSKWLESFE
jgi:hypothetical protein